MPVGQTAPNTCIVLTNLSTAQNRSSSSSHLSLDSSLSVEAAVHTFQHGTAGRLDHTFSHRAEHQSMEVGTLRRNQFRQFELFHDTQDRGDMSVRCVA